LPTVNFSAIAKSRWKLSLRDNFREAIDDLTEPFTLESLYPAREIEWPEGSGKYISIRQIMPHQMAAHRGITPSGKEAKYIMLSGGVGNGKSINMCVQIVWLLRKHPGIKIVLIAPYDYMITEFFLPTLRTVLPDESPLIRKINVKDGIYYMRNGSQIRMKAYEDATRIRGWQCHCVFITEAAQIGDANPYKAAEIFKALGERQREPGNFPRKFYLDQNPSGHNWSWKIFVKPNLLGDAGTLTKVPPDQYRKHEVQFREYEHTDPISGDTYYTISAGTHANPFNPSGYIESMLAHRRDDPLMKARMIDGSFTPINTLVYDLPYYSKQSHLIDIYRFLDYWEIDHDNYEDPRDAIPRSWPMYVGIDSAGASSPWAIECYIETPPDDLGHSQYICAYEIYTKGKGWAEMADAILDLTEGWEHVQYFIDPYHSKQASGPNQEAIFDEFIRHGIPVQAPKGYNKAASIKRVQEYLARDLTVPCPYIDDYYMDDPDRKEGDLVEYEIGCARLYYLCRWVNGELEPYAKANILEKQEYRYDSRKQRQASESEEGLSPQGPEKIIDRDDHAQTAEMFAFLGIEPLPRGRTRSKRLDDNGNGPSEGRKRRTNR
jgi:hypothetical protein